MADKDTIWTAVVARYTSSTLIALTNPNDPSATTVNTTFGTEAANGAINLWPIYAQVAFDVTNSIHIEAAVRGTIAVLQSRGASAPNVAKIAWEDVFSKDGMIGQVAKTGSRGRPGPKTNSNLTQPTGLTADSRRKIPWSHPSNLPSGILPSDKAAT